MKFFISTLLSKQAILLYLLLFSAMGYATTYTFTGSGNWSNSSNWSGGSIPPVTLPLGNDIIINGTGTCIFDDPYDGSLFQVQGNYVINASKTLTINSGETRIEGSLFTVNGTLNINVSDGMNYDNGTVNISGTINSTVSDGLTSVASGTVNILAGGAINVDGGSVRFRGSGSVAAGGTLTISNSGQVIVYYSTLTNNGTITNASGCTVHLEGVTAIINNLGTFTNNGNITRYQGYITGSGMINGSGSFAMNYTNLASATLSPGNSPGCMVIDGNFVNEGLLEIELADGVACTDFDQVQIINGNAATIGGNINITFPSGTPTTKTFAIVTTTGTKTDNSPTISWPAGFSGSGSFVGDEYQVTFSESLPVELVNFSGVLQQNNEVHLKWNTASEDNNAYFDIQRSDDARNWVEIGRTTGNGSSAEGHSYSFIDELPQPGNNYYRLKQVDFDGRYEFSKAVNIALSKREGNIQFWPNPSHGIARLYVDADALGEAKLSLYNSVGTLMKESMLTLEEGHPNFDLDFTNLPTGIYVAILSTDGQYWKQQLVVY